MYHHLRNLFVLSGVALDRAIAGIPEGVTALDLSTNDLNLKTAADIAHAFRGIPATVTTLNLSGNHLNEKNTAALAQICAGIPAHIHELTLSLDDIRNRTPEELIALGQALPYMMTLHVIDDTHPVSHPWVTVLRSQIGAGFLDDLEQEGQPRALALMSLERLTGVSIPQIEGFLHRRAQMHAAAQEQLLAGEQLLALEQAAAQEWTVEQESYACQFRCLCALSAASAIELIAGIAALSLAAPVGFGIGLTAAGAIGALTSGYGLFRLSPPGRHEPALRSVMDEQYREGSNLDGGALLL